MPSEYVIPAVVLGACLCILAFVVVRMKMGKRAFARDLERAAASLGLQPVAAREDAYAGVIHGWSITLALEDVSALPSDSPLVPALAALGAVAAALGESGPAISARQARDASKQLVFLTIDGASRPADLDALFGAVDWEHEASGWSLLVVGDNKLRWAQDYQPGQAKLRGMDPVELLARTLKV